MSVTTTYENRTGKGNTKAMRVEVRETPHSPAGKAHASLVVVLNSGQETVRDGNYYPTLEAALLAGKAYEEKVLALGLVRQES